MTTADDELSEERRQFNPSAVEIEKLVEDVLTRSTDTLNRVAEVKDEDVTIDNVMSPVLEFIRDFDDVSAQVKLISYVSPVREIRDSSFKLLEKLSASYVDFRMRLDVFKKLQIVKALPEASDMSDERKRGIDRLITEGKRNGLHLSDDIQSEVKRLEKEIASLSNEFEQNLAEENTKLFFTEKELDGLPKDFISALDKADDGKVTLSLKYPHVKPCLKKCRVPNTRYIVRKAFNSRCMKENTILLEKVLKLRFEKAQLLGYKDHSSFILERRMAKTPEAVANFLTDLSQKISPLVSKEREQLLKYKMKECNELGLKYDSVINDWDRGYYMNKVEELDYLVDHDKLQEYFPISTVTDGLFKIYQEVLGVVFTQVNDTQLWHEDAKLFKVTDTDTNSLIGHFYMDMYPREGKYGHACCIPLARGCLKQDGTRALPACVLVCNFTKDTADKPALLTHDEVTTYFHEFGHAMHNMFAQTETAIFSNTNVERDFVEAPSQMLENWCWSYETLSLMSSHYKTKEVIPKAVVENLAASRKANAGNLTMTQIVYATFDQRIHSTSEADIAAVFDEVMKSLLDVSPIEGTSMPASFGHMIGGYDAQYYSYLWSEVFSVDMFATRFENVGLLNKKAGHDYRDCILKPGGSKDAAVLLRQFLGRDPEMGPFLKLLGL